MSRIAVTMLLAASAALAQEPYDQVAERAYEEQVVEKRKEEAFKRIEWREGAKSARKDAQAGGKPILVFIVVGEMARKNAPDC